MSATAAPRNGLGAATFVVVLLGAVLAIFPGTAAFGLLVCLLAIVPAIVAYLRARRGGSTNRRRSLAALVLAPTLFLVAAGVVGTTAPGSADLPREAATAVRPAAAPAGSEALGSVGSASDAPATPAPVPAAEPQPEAMTAPAPASAPSTARPATRLSTAPPLAQEVAAPVAAAPRTAPKTTPHVAPKSTPKTPASANAVAAKPAVSKKPTVSAPPRGSTSSCDSGTHYVNDDGNCVLRPQKAAQAPGGASAKCQDGTYSYSQHRRGTCSGHGGVAQWLPGAPRS